MIEFTLYSKNQIMVKRPGRLPVVETLTKNQTLAGLCRKIAVRYISDLVGELRRAVNDLQPWDQWRLIQFDEKARSVQHYGIESLDYCDEVNTLLRKVYLLRRVDERINDISVEIKDVLQRYFEVSVPVWYPVREAVPNQLDLFVV